MNNASRRQASLPPKDNVRTGDASLRNVLRNPRSYISFILALLLIQTLLCLLIGAAALDIKNTDLEINASYDYDVLLRGISQPQYAVMYNADAEITDEMREFLALPYREMRFEPLTNGDYNVYISLRGEDHEQELFQMNNAFFEPALAADSKNLFINYSPRFNYPSYLGSLYAQAVISIFLLLSLATFLMVILQRTRLNHEKYQYGIYMTFGAGYRQLFSVALRELLVIIMLTTLPALLLGNVAVALLCIGTGKAWSPSIAAIFLPPLLTLLITFISVRFPVKFLSARTPVELLTAKDNSNLVTSPRRSLRIFGRSFPFTYELFSLWRYRRYLAGLLLSTMLFASLWLGLVRIADFNTAKDNTPTPEYTVSLDEVPSSAVSLGITLEELAVEIEALDGVDYCDYREETNIMELRGFMAVSGDAAKHAASYTVYNRDKLNASHPRATNAVRYVAYDEYTVRRLTERYEDIEGDPYAVLQNDRNVILSTALNNTTRFDFSPGDTVWLATNKMTSITEVMVTNNLDLLRMMLADEEFLLEEYTVCAVIHDERSDDRLICGMNNTAYEKLTGVTPYATDLHVYLSDHADFATLDTVDAGIQVAAADFYDAKVTSHNTLFSRYLGSFRNLSARIITAAYFLLVMMPLFSFFSQRVFYGKREKEWFVLKTLGADRSKRKLLLLASGLILTAVNFLAMLPLGLLSDFIAFKLCNEWLPAGGFITSALMHYSLSPIVIPVLLFFALLCGFTPCFLEYLQVKKQMQAEDITELLLAKEKDQYQSQKEVDTDVSEKNQTGA